MIHSEWLTTGEAAALLGKSRRSVQWYVQLRILPAHRWHPNGHWRIRREDLDRFQKEWGAWFYKRRKWGEIG